LIIFQMNGLSLACIQFKCERLLADQSTCLVLLAEDLDNPRRIVVKQPKAQCGQTLQELAILPLLSHPGIMKLEGVARTPHGDAPVYAYAPHGDLFAQLNTGPLPENLVKQIMFQLFDAVAYLHNHGVWHRDLKPENVLVLNGDLTSVAITDFGLAVRPGVPALRDGFIATIQYSPPEVLLNSSYNQKVDTWALGITMFVCLTGWHPFDYGQTLEELAQDIIWNDFGSVEQFEAVGESAMNLLVGLLAKKPENRLSADQALCHPWFDDIRPEPVVNA
jgi:serine/threonine-protein kinase Chk2